MSVEVLTKYNKEVIIDDFKLSRDIIESPATALFIFEGYYKGEKICNLGSYLEIQTKEIISIIKQLNRLLNKSRLTGEQLTYCMPNNIYNKMNLQTLSKNNFTDDKLLEIMKLNLEMLENDAK